MTRALAHSIHVTVRIHAGQTRKEADVSLPLSSSVGEVLGELLLLVDVSPAPILWRATTAGGKAVSMTAPLDRTPLEDGSVLVLSPDESPPAPIVRDAAEALAADAPSTALDGLADVWGCAGLIAIGGLLTAALSPALGCAAAAILAVVLAVWTQRGSLLAAAHIAAGLAGWFGVGGSDASSAALAGSAAALAIVAFLSHLLRTGGLRARAIAATWCVLAVIGLLGAAPLLAAILGLLAGAPLLTTRLAGLRVPQLPTAGQDLSISDDVPTDNADKARRAGEAYEGIAVGCALAGIPAVLIVALSAHDAEIVRASQALCLSIAGGVIVHAARHARTVAAWALGLLGVAAACGAVAVAVREWQLESSPTATTWVLSVVAGLVIVAMLSAPMWAGALAHVEPTTIVWFERAEAFALAACLPLAAHVAGLFEFIRGLGS
ncbi:MULTISPECIES: type VII secretion integral membrane protein EccD [Corynebacterium]|uniref:Type VII secretion integral membrane protein EccD n=1 Tax=Corynebacterium singulare TaxID=161899 RepID=A0A0B6F211_9CORY|nr:MULTISPECIES: type VII secretion integral membrane protein EccD [Corynebacterium]AJI78056.1 type VII secretion integral membrane protein EccD [Corynebacterium singulare]OFT60053.1 type VII secretion integral membrane protein EccD [Corynebacterium sp. HMSC05E07]